MDLAEEVGLDHLPEDVAWQLLEVAVGHDAGAV